MGIFEVVEIVEQLAPIVPIVTDLINNVTEAIESAKDIDPNDKEELISRIRKAQAKVKTWDELEV